MKYTLEMYFSVYLCIYLDCMSYCIVLYYLYLFYLLQKYIIIDYSV